MYYCGIDVAKRKHSAMVLNEEAETVKQNFTFRNNREGFDKLLAALAPFTGELVVALEATGHYWLSLYECLAEAKHPVVVLNPLQVHAYQRSGVRKRKNDRIDAFWIADYARISNSQATDQAAPELLQLRDLTRFRLRLRENIGDCKRKLLSILDRVFPEYETLFSDVFLTTSRQLLAQAITAQEFADFDLAELTQLLSSASRGRFGQDKAEAIIEHARRSVGVNLFANSARLQIDCLLEQLNLLEQQTQQMDQSIEELMNQLPQHITSIPGVGPVTGAAILAEIGDIHRFEAPEKLVAYAGIDATVYQSGDFEAAEAHISKRGSPFLRLAIWQAATMTAIYDPQLKAYYQQKKAEGKHHGVAIGAVARKLLARIYIILKENRPYEIRY
jgi:transposase